MFHEVRSPSDRFLQAQAWFGTLPAATQERVLRNAFTRAGKKGEVMLAADTPVDGWYAVMHGLVKLQSQSTQKRLSAFLGVPSGEWFGEGSVLKSELRRYNVIALRDTELLCLPRAEFDELRLTSLAFNQALVAQLNLRLGQAMTIIEASRLRNPEQRVAQTLSPLFWPGMRQVRLTQEELGHLAGLSRQTVNRVLRSLEQQGLVSLAFGGVVISSAEALAAYLATPLE